MVIGVIAVIASIVGVGLSGGSEGAALTSAREIMQAQLTAARSQAALRGYPGAVVIVADTDDPDRYLRHVAVAVVDASGTFTVLHDGANLPGEVRVREPGDGSTLLAGPQLVAVDPGAVAIPCYLVSFDPHGGLTGAGGGEIWLAVAQRRADGVIFPPEAPAVGLAISRYGAVVAFEEGDANE